MFRRLWSLLSGANAGTPVSVGQKPQGGPQQVVVGEEVAPGTWDSVLMANANVTAIHYSALLDDSTCEHCRVLDGKAYTKEAWLRIAPPVACLNGEECRCIGVGILAAECPQPEVVDVGGLPALGIARADGDPL